MTAGLSWSGANAALQVPRASKVSMQGGQTWQNAKWRQSAIQMTQSHSPITPYHSQRGSRVEKKGGEARMAAGEFPGDRLGSSIVVFNELHLFQLLMVMVINAPRSHHMPQ